jgi:hypothetical protein
MAREAGRSGSAVHTTLVRSQLTAIAAVVALAVGCGDPVPEPVDAGGGPVDAFVEVDGGPDGCRADSECDTGESCVFPLGACGGLGRCFDGTGDCSVSDLFCACDGMTYTDCDILTQRLSVRSRGACP